MNPYALDGSSGPSGVSAAITLAAAGRREGLWLQTLAPCCLSRPPLLQRGRGEEADSPRIPPLGAPGACHPGGRHSGARLSHLPAGEQYNWAERAPGAELGPGHCCTCTQSTGLGLGCEAGAMLRGPGAGNGSGAHFRDPASGAATGFLCLGRRLCVKPPGAMSPGSTPHWGDRQA